MTCDNFKFNGLVAGDVEVEFADKLFMLTFDASDGVDAELFNCDFILGEDEEDFSRDNGFAGTENILFITKNFSSNLR